MSKYLRLIPRNPTHVVSHADVDRARSFLLHQVPGVRDVDAQLWNQAQFFHYGRARERTTCPRCADDVSDWFVAQMGELFQRQVAGLPDDLGGTTPCCHARLALNELRFELGAGVACAMIRVYGAKVAAGLEPDVLSRLEAIVGCDLLQRPVPPPARTR